MVKKRPIFQTLPPEEKKNSILKRYFKDVMFTTIISVIAGSITLLSGLKEYIIQFDIVSLSNIPDYTYNIGIIILSTTLGYYLGRKKDARKEELK